MRITFDTRVLRGFPVTVEALVEREDRCDYAQVGAYKNGRYCVVEIELFKRGVRKLVPFIERQLTDSDWETLNQEAIDALNGD